MLKFSPVNSLCQFPGGKGSTQFEILCSARLTELKEQHKPKTAKELSALEARAVKETIFAHKTEFAAHREHAVTMERR